MDFLPLLQSIRFSTFSFLFYRTRNRGWGPIVRFLWLVQLLSIASKRDDYLSNIPILAFLLFSPFVGIIFGTYIFLSFLWLYIFFSISNRLLACFIRRSLDRNMRTLTLTHTQTQTNIYIYIISTSKKIWYLRFKVNFKNETSSVKLLV